MPPLKIHYVICASVKMICKLSLRRPFSLPNILSYLAQAVSIKPDSPYFLPWSPPEHDFGLVLSRRGQFARIYCASSFVNRFGGFLKVWTRDFSKVSCCCMPSWSSCGHVRISQHVGAVRFLDMFVGHQIEGKIRTWQINLMIACSKLFKSIRSIFQCV